MAGPLFQWLNAGLAEAGLAVDLMETRHVRDLQVDDAQGYAIGSPRPLFEAVAKMEAGEPVHR